MRHNMEPLKEKLNIVSLLDKPNLHETLKELAETIMNDYCIDNGQYQYRPIEIEFYIYDHVKHPDKHVYPRDNKSAGELFFHYSGMDICFDSSLADGHFGGILIRALERDNDNISFGGPLVCLNEVLNTAHAKCELKQFSRPKSDRVHAVPFGKRVGINGEDQYSQAPYRFIKEGLTEIKMTRLTYNFDKSESKIYSNTYKLQ